MSLAHKNRRKSSIARQLWKLKKASVFARDRGVCAHCGLDTVRAGGKWQAHHLSLLSNGGNDHIDNIVTLCHRCHQDFHNGKLAPNYPRWWIWWYEVQTGRRWVDKGPRKHIYGLVRRRLRS